jgi:hypothetical protein
MSVARYDDSRYDDKATKDMVYVWPTHLAARELLGKCDPFERNGSFSAQVEVVIYPGKSLKPQPNQVLRYEDYVTRAKELDASAAAVRFNASSSALGEFSILWVPHQRKYSTQVHTEVLNQVHAIVGDTPGMMSNMIKGSITMRGKPMVRSLMTEGHDLETDVSV